MALSWLTYALRHRPGVAKFFDRGGALQKIFHLKKILGIAPSDLLQTERDHDCPQSQLEMPVKESADFI